MILQAFTEFDQDMNMAKDIAETLHAQYPGHAWAVAVKGGVAVIKDLYISSLWGYVLKYAAIKDDAGVRRKTVIRAGGEILERAHQPRAARVDGLKPHTLEGVPDYKPLGVH